MPFIRGWKNVSAVRLAIGLVGIFLALFIALMIFFIGQGATQTRDRFGDQSRAAVRVVSINASWISEVANQTLRRIDGALGADLAIGAQDLAGVLDGLPSRSQVSVVDRNAMTLYSTLPATDGVPITDRAYFSAVRDGAPFYVSSLLTSRVTGNNVFVFSKRIERGREFAGAIIVSFPETLLGEIAATLDLPRGSTVSLAREDGHLMARFPTTDEPLDLSQRPLFTTLLPAAPEGTYDLEASPVDGAARVVSYQRVAETPIVALAAVATAPGWAEFNAGVLTIVFIASPIILALILGCLWVVRLLLREEQRGVELQASVDLNTMLFREIHHRVKNNLQSVQALVRMQNIPETAKRDLQSRFAAMAAMHEHIYQMDRYEDIDAAEFIPAVVLEVRKAYGADAELVFEIASLPVDRDHATPLALLLSELVTNALKYAFPDDGGRITISLVPRDDGLVTLTVRDTGVGMAEPEQSKSMGMRLIRGVVGQMGGSHSFRNDNGLVFEAILALTVVGRQAAESAEQKLSA